MRIGIEAQRIFRKKKHGMDIYAIQLIRQLMEIHSEHEFFIFVKKGEDICLTETENCHIVYVPGLTYLDWEQIWLPIYASRYRLDLLHCTSNTGPLITSIPLVLTLHDIIYLQQGYQGGSLYQRLGHYYRKWIVPTIFRKAKQVITVSQFERQTIQNHFGLSDKNVEVTYNGVNQLFNAELPIEQIATVRKQYQLPEDYLFFLGNTAPKKNMKGVLQAYARYVAKDSAAMPLVLAESSAEVVDQILEELSIAHIRHKLQLTGYLSHADLPAVYHMATALIYTSLRESFGIPILEAMACGTAVITSNTSSMPEVAGESAILVDPTDVEKMAMAILEVTTNTKLRNQLEQSGLERIRQFRWEQTASATMGIYHDACHPDKWSSIASMSVS